ncbi:MAG: hypothetical protein V2J19_04080 [Wenzhouxiangella sp.]|jgi:hypothetical protein|nr:hypothetical protein [Wenzhouxiangella sp.]
MSSIEHEAIDAGYEEFGESATFVPIEGNSFSCEVVIDHNLQKWGEVVTVGNANAVVSIRRAEASERPRRGDLVEMSDGTSYRVDQVLAQTRFEYQLLAIEDIE